MYNYHKSKTERSDYFMNQNRNGFEMLYEKVLEPDMCSFCGACAFVCPSKNLVLQDERPKQIRKCKGACNNCFAVCPQVLHENNSLNQYNNSENYYIGKSLNKGLLDQVASGGAITSILICLLEQKKIDAAIITQFNSEEPWAPESILTNSSIEISKSGYSKYALSPTVNLLNDIVDKGYENIAFMGLPCHIESIHIMKNLIKQDPSKFDKKVVSALKSIKYSIGLWCGKNFSKEGTKSFISTLGIDPQDVSKVGYEHKDSNLNFIILSNNNKISVSFEVYLGYLLSNYINPACKKCTRCYADHSNLSIGGLNNPGLRWSGIITHNDLGKNILDLAVEMKYIELYPMPDEQIFYTKMKKIYRENREM